MRYYPLIPHKTWWVICPTGVRKYTIRGKIIHMAAITNSIKPELANKPIRSFNPVNDLLRVADLIELCFSNSLDQDGRRYLQQMRDFTIQPSWLARLPRFAEWTGAPFIGYVWEESSELIGNISLIPFRIRNQSYYLIANVAVHPDHRRRGIARNLTLQGIEHARQHHAAGIWLSVKEDNQAASELYHGLGFRERGRRSTWHAQHEYSKAIQSSGLTIAKLQPSEWSKQKSWLERSYPQELRWNMPINLRMFRPGLLGSLLRLFSNISIKNWAAYHSGGLLATSTLQSSMTHTSRIWLGAPKRCNLSALQDLLIYSRQQIPARSTFVLEYPVGTADLAIQAAGLRRHQTLIWMELERL